MAGHSKFKNIMHRKGAQDAKRAKKFAKIVREIVVAVKSGGSDDPEFNPRLRTAIAAGKSINLPKDKIENAIKKATSNQEGDDFEEVRYECYAPGGIALIIDGLTDNRNRTAGEVKASLSKYNATLAEPGSVLYMFKHVGLIAFEINENIDTNKLLESAIDAGVEDYNIENNECFIYCNTDEFNNVREILAKKFGDPTESKLIWKPENTLVIEKLDQAESLLKLIDILEDNDDVQSVNGNYAISEGIIKKLNI